MTDVAASPDPFEELLLRGVRAFDPAEVAHLTALRARASEERLAARLQRLEASFDETRAAVERHLDDVAYDEATRAEMRVAFDAGDFIAVEILASTRPRRRPSAYRDEWQARIRARAEERGVVDTEGLADALLAAAAVEARAASIAAEARALDLESVGPYNPYALALRVLGRLDDLAPTYLASWVAFLEDVAALEPEPVVEKPSRRRR